MNRVLSWLGFEDPCAKGHLPVLVPPLDTELHVSKCGRCGRLLEERCVPGWCVERDGSCLKCGWPVD